ncbi:MAG TPA: hypothetical protein DDW55_09065 [Gammaproteobacteria bacterium]|nr:hypothetical protein [Gammaproteobacteria bacterium]
MTPSHDVQSGLDKLNGLLPLKKRQALLTHQERTLHIHILESFLETGHPLSRDVEPAIVDDAEMDQMLATLAEGDLVVLVDDGRSVTGAYPFTTENRPHCVTVNGNTVHAMCALDAVSVAPMFNVATEISSVCHVTGAVVKIAMTGKVIEAVSPEGVHVGIRWQSTSGCAAKNLCMEMIFLADASVAADWKQGDSDNISIYTIAEAVMFGGLFFRPLVYRNTQ